MNIPKGNTKQDIKEREKIISDVYRKWYADHPDKKVYNHSLQDYVNVRYLSITETIRHGAKQYKSTLAILQLNFILRYAKKYGKPKNPKKGVKNQKDFEKMQELRCYLSNVGDVKLIVGIKKNREHIQYCITAVRT